MPESPETGISLHYEIVGEGPPLCLITGYRQSSAAWPRPFIAALAARFTVVTFDNRGTGLSDKPMDGYEFDQQALDVVRLLNEVRHPRTHLLGYSMGGAVAQEVALRYPDRVDRLILFATFCGGVFSEAAPWSVLRRLFETDGLSPEEAMRQSWPVTYSPAYLAANAEAVEQQMRRELVHPTPAFATRMQMAALRKFDRYRDLPRISSPTLVATGSDDVLVKPRNSAILAARIPGARLESLADLGHRAIWEAPEEIAGLIGDFLTKPIAGV
jgi:3-oxoadipate enol-lactonase